MNFFIQKKPKWFTEKRHRSIYKNLRKMIVAGHSFGNKTKQKTEWFEHEIKTLNEFQNVPVEKPSLYDFFQV